MFADTVASLDESERVVNMMTSLALLVVCVILPVDAVVHGCNSVMLLDISEAVMKLSSTWLAAAS